tara:strand:+ start:605 stop:1573 length:969 start_codon:yes stop_codon:yes gene_type:complete
MNKAFQFHAFSKNLDLVLKASNPKIHIKPWFEEGNYICPIGFTLHSLKGLSDEFDDQLTIEHAPPKSMGGKACCLVRKDINNKSGHTSDKMLLDFLKGLRFNYGEGPILSKLFMGLPRMKSPLALFQVDKNQRLNFTILSSDLESRLHPDFFKSGFSMQMQFKIQEMNQQIKCLLLKIAYLHAFKQLGYSLLLDKRGGNPHYKQVREQILNPDKDIFPIVLEIVREKKLEGVAIITHPKKVACLIVGYKLVLEGTDFWVNVFLPAPDSRGFKALEFITDELKKKPRVNITYQQIGDFDISGGIKNAKYFYHFWDKHRGWKYR